MGPMIFEPAQSHDRKNARLFDGPRSDNASRQHDAPLRRRSASLVAGFSIGYAVEAIAAPLRISTKPSDVADFAIRSALGHGVRSRTAYAHVSSCLGFRRPARRGDLGEAAQPWVFR